MKKIYKKITQLKVNKLLKSLKKYSPKEHRYGAKYRNDFYDWTPEYKKLIGRNIKLVTTTWSKVAGLSDRKKVQLFDYIISKCRWYPDFEIKHGFIEITGVIADWLICNTTDPTAIASNHTQPHSKRSHIYIAGMDTP